MNLEDANVEQEAALTGDERQEWVDAFHATYRHAGKAQAQAVLQLLAQCAQDLTIEQPYSITTPYRNSIDTQEEIAMPGDADLESRIRSIVRWNAMAMVLRANKRDSSLGGHISTFSSIATLYDVGFNHFFRGTSSEFAGDLLFLQGHSSPGVYARSFLEGRIDEQRLDLFRTEAFEVGGLSSYPHPRLMSNYWQFPTVSMGLGPLQAIYQAHFMKYMANRQLQDEADRKVWCFVGDGETDEPETLGAISLAGREKLNNLIFVINCNLQRLDGPVRGNGKVIQDLEGQFRGAGWNVIKLVWGGDWDPLLRQDTDGLLQKRMDEAVDGEYQNCKAQGGAYTRTHFFGKYPELLKRVEHLSDEDIYRLRRGGHDPLKVYNAYHRAVNSKNKPTVILAKTVKGYGTTVGEARNTTHSMKKMDDASLLAFRDRFNLPLSDEQVKNLEYYRPHDKSPEIEYIHNRRTQLHGFLPARKLATELITCKPANVNWVDKFTTAVERENSTTMVFVRILSALLRDKEFGKYVVPIVPDEARTFGMEGLFKQIGIYTSEGQKYIPQDSEQVVSYHEAINGQILQEGISEPGAFSTWVAAATSGYQYNHSMVPFYIYYSIFGFQRIGDLAWAAGDLQARGFLLGATAGRTTLAGEGLQHDDGHSVILASTVPSCVTYDVAYSYELAIVIESGLKRMFIDKESIYYYIMLYNENYVHPGINEVADDNVRDGIIQGMYLFAKAKDTCSHSIHLLSSGSIFGEARAATDLLAEYDVGCNIWSVTSFTELARQAEGVVRHNALNADKKANLPFVAQRLKDKKPTLAVTDYVRQYVQQIAPFIKNPYMALGTDGFGRSDSRENLRRFFEIDAAHICFYALALLVEQQLLDASVLKKARKKLGIAANKPYSLYA